MGSLETLRRKLETFSAYRSHREDQARYWPSLSLVTRVPGLREVATGNCAIELRRR